MDYEIPLENGDYTIHLHFAELWFGATGGGIGSDGLRVFDVLMEDELVEDNLDIYALVGAETLITKTYTVAVTDGQLNIHFSSLSSDGGTRHPVINAIEILAELPADSEEEDIEEEVEEEAEEEGVEEEDIEEETEEEEAEEEGVEEEDSELEELVGHWPLDEQNGTNAIDASPQGRIGTLKNGLSFDTDKTNGQIGGAVVFDGIEDRISLPDIDDNLELGFSVSAWVNPSNAEGGYQGIVGSSTAGGFMMFIQNNQLAFKVTTNENGLKLVSAGNIQNNLWQMITCTYDGNDMRWYINGENVHNESLPGPLKDKSVAWLGWSGWSDEFFEGGIDDVRIYNKALTDQEIFSIFEKEAINTLPAYIALPDVAQNEVIQAYAYPNPTTSSFMISGLNEGTKDIVVSDMAGFVLKAFATDMIAPVFDLSVYPKGIYIVKVVQNGFEHAFKVVKE